MSHYSGWPRHAALLELLGWGICGGHGVPIRCGLFETCSCECRVPYDAESAEQSLSRPETASSFLGSLNTLINVYSSHNGYWSTTAVVAVTINTVFLVGMLASLLIYKYGLHMMVGSGFDPSLRRRFRFR